LRGPYGEKERKKLIDVLERIQTLDNNGLLPLNGKIHCKLKGNCFEWSVFLSFI
jgi:hypothetical protein